MIINRILLSLTILLSLRVSSFGDWTDPVRASWGFPFLSQPRAVTVGDTIHVVATEGSSDVFYLVSRDNGENWSDPISFVEGFDAAWMPDIAYSDGSLHIVFKAYGVAESRPMMHVVSSDGGRHWSEPNVVTFHIWKYPRIEAHGDTLFASLLGAGINVLRSFNRGQTWSDTTIVEYGELVIDHDPDICFALGRLHLTYQMNIVGDSLSIEIYHRYSDDYGLTWSDRQVLSTPEPSPYCEAGQNPSAFVDSSGNMIVTWFDYKYGSRCTGFEGEILGCVSTDNGESWLPETRISRTQSGTWPSCLIVNDVLYSVWQDMYAFGYCAWSKIMFAKSFDWGMNWTGPILITGTGRHNEEFPYLCHNTIDGEPVLHGLYSRGVSGGIWHVMGYHEYTTIEEIEDGNIPIGLALKAYPNPFNSSTVINFSNLKGGDIVISIFNLSGQEIKSFNMEETKEGKIIWDASDAMGNKLSSGIYFARAKTPQEIRTIKLSYIK